MNRPAASPHSADIRDGDAVAALLFRRIGDSLLATPALRAIKCAYPNTAIHVFCESHVARVFDRLAFVERVCPMEKSPSPFLLAQMLKGVPRLKVTLDFLSDPRSAVASWLCGAKYRVGFARSFRQLLYNRRVPLQDPARPIYSAVHKLGLAHAIGATSIDVSTAFAISETDNSAAQSLLARLGPARKPPVAFFISSRRDYKRWPVDRFADVCKSIESSQEYSPVVIGGPGEHEDIEKFCRHIELPITHAISFADIGEMAAFLKQCRVLICNDGGPKHLAVAMGTPTVTIFQNDPWQYWTPGEDPRHVAIGGAGLSPSAAEVIDAAWKLLRLA